MKNTKTRIPAIILAIAAILMVVSFFLPYAAAVDDSLSGEYANMSMFDFAKAYAESSNSYYMLYTVLVCIIGLFTSLVLLFALIRKPIPAIVFVILATAVFWIQCWDYKDRGIVPGLTYEYGIAYYLFYISAISVFVTSIWYLCVRNDKTPPPTQYNQYTNTIN